MVPAFIGVKLVIEAMHASSLPFVNGGESIHLVPATPTWLSLVITISILAVTTIASLLKNRRAASATAYG